MISKLRILLTGGTIDDYHLVPKNKKGPRSYINQMLKQARVDVPIVMEHICEKDSREINEIDLEKILASCKNCKEGRIVITHGTFTMAKTAQYLGSKINNKVIVLTGAAIPFVERKSDALFNLGSAIVAAQFLKPGVYIAMNGKIFSFDNVEKNLETERFVEKNLKEQFYELSKM